MNTWLSLGQYNRKENTRYRIKMLEFYQVELLSKGDKGCQIWKFFSASDKEKFVWTSPPKKKNIHAVWGLASFRIATRGDIWIIVSLRRERNKNFEAITILYRKHLITTVFTARVILTSLTCLYSCLSNLLFIYSFRFATQGKIYKESSSLSQRLGIH